MLQSTSSLLQSIGAGEERRGCHVGRSGDKRRHLVCWYIVSVGNKLLPFSIY